jgi:acetyl esterase/lipase
MEVIRDITYREVEGVRLTLDLYLPDGAGPYPAIVFVPGGAWHTGDKSTFAGYAEHFASLGYVGVVVNYRLAPAFVFPTQLSDLRCALAWLHDLAPELQVALDRVVLIGESAGGHLAALLALAPPELGPCEGEGIVVRAVVSLYGPMDLTLYNSNPAGAVVVTDFLGASYAEDPELWRRASPIYWVRPDAPPFLLIHGTADLVVPPRHSIAMAEALKAAGARVKLVLIPFAAHEFHLIPLGPSWTALREIKKFLNRVLLPRT